MTIEMPEFKTWEEEADFWDRTDTAPWMEKEEGEWIGPGRVQAAVGLCRRCGARMELRHLDVAVARGRIILHSVEFYVCPRCEARTLPPDRQEFIAWEEAELQEPR
jgi:ribosomal protein L40E